MNIITSFGQSISSFIEFLGKINITNILAISGVFISTFTLLEMRKQRKESYRPRLLIKKETFWLKTNHNNTPCSMFKEEHISEKEEVESFRFYITNIGLGSAHDIKIYLKYDTSSIINMFKNFEETKRIKVDNSQIFYAMDSGSNYGIRIDDHEKEEKLISYIKPNESLSIPIPQIIHDVVTFIPYLKILSDGKRGYDDKSNLFVIEIEYKDIGNRRYFERSVVEISTYIPYDNDIYGVGDITFKIK